MVTSTVSSDQLICSRLLPLTSSSLSSSRGRGQWAQHASSPSRAANPHPRIPLADQGEQRAVADTSEMVLHATGVDATQIRHLYPALGRASTRQLQPWRPTTQNASADRTTYRDRPHDPPANPPREAPGEPTKRTRRPLLCEYREPPYRPNRRIRRRHRDRPHTPRALPAAAAQNAACKLMVRVWIDVAGVRLRPPACQDQPLPMGGLAESCHHRRLQMTASSCAPCASTGVT